jgi:hypothetical protein
VTLVLLLAAAAIGFCGGYVSCTLSVIERHQARTTRLPSSRRCAGCGREAAPGFWSTSEEGVCVYCDH